MRKKAPPKRHTHTEPVPLPPAQPELKPGATLQQFERYIFELAAEHVVYESDSERQAVRELWALCVGAGVPAPPERRGGGSLSFREWVDGGFGWQCCWPRDTRSPTLPLIIDWFARQADAPCTVRASIIPEAGYGLFARRDIARGERITVYGGIRMSHDYYHFHGIPGFYVIGTAHGEIVDGTSCFRLSEMARWANSILPSSSALSFGAESFLEPGNVPILRATRNIAAGEEIFIDYGPHYPWDEVMHKRPRVLEACVQCHATLPLAEVMAERGSTLDAGIPALFCGVQCRRQYRQKSRK
jgi:hypothetical protein